MRLTPQWPDVASYIYLTQIHIIICNINHDLLRLADLRRSPHTSLTGVMGMTSVTLRDPPKSGPTCNAQGPSYVGPYMIMITMSY